jgi:hypothetical protein
MSVEYEVNLHTWFMTREINIFPRHFVVAKTPITHESKQWILESLRGRFCIVTSLESSEPAFLGMPSEVPAFEDPQEAVFYELKWS